MNTLHDLKRVRWAAFALCFVGVLSGCATHHQCGMFGCRGDKKITLAVETVIRKYPALEAPNHVRVQTIDHVVYLYGQVSTDLQRSTAEQAALSVDGAVRVVDSISLDFEGK